MKKLVIIRHGKAVPYGYENDFGRELRERGKNDASIISSKLKDRGITPDLIVSSPAQRAIQTACIFAENLNYDTDSIQQEQSIYDGLTTNEFIELLSNIPNEKETVFIFGHNPGFHYFVANLLNEFNGDMPTTSTVGVNFDVENWSDIKTRSGVLDFHLIPKMVK